MKKKPTLSKLKKTLDAIFSKYIRYYYAVKELGNIENGKCYTCDTIQPTKKMQNSHFVPRQCLTTRYHLDNCRIGCYVCNMLYGGNIAEYGERLKKEIGEDRVQNLIELRRKFFKGEYQKLTIEWYQEQIEIYKNKVEELENPRINYKIEDLKFL